MADKIWSMPMISSDTGEEIFIPPSVKRRKSFRPAARVLYQTAAGKRWAWLKWNKEPREWERMNGKKIPERRVVKIDHDTWLQTQEFMDSLETQE